MSMFGTIISSIVITFHVVGVWMALRAVLISRTPQAAIGWSLALAICPYLAIPLFLVFGESRFSGYSLAIEGKSAELTVELQGTQNALKEYETEIGTHGDSAATMACLLSGLPATRRNAVKLLINGRETFDAIFKAIDEAKEFIIVQFFIIRADEIGEELRDHLLKALQHGVRVWMVYDAIGSKSLPQSYIDSLKTAGAEVCGFVTNRKIGTRFQMNFRNHRKLVIIDSRLAFIGGLNVGDEYMGRSKQFGPWRDTHIRIEGPAVQALQIPFIEDWYYTNNTVLHLPRHAIPSPTGDAPISLLASGPASRVHLPIAVLNEIIYRTKKRLWLASPYFIPDSALRGALQNAALRGVDVRVLLPQNPDHKLPYWSSFSFYPAMRDAGVKIFRYQPGFMHQKVLLADDDLAMVGSLNLDYRSLMLNFELSAVVEDPQFAKRIEQMFQEDFLQSKEEDLSIFQNGSVFFRLKARFAALLAPVQ